ncbi:MAG: hypothetical protein IT165_01775 [Bryobacterales bacterium]|nr:hypothetical protein [Bryobacterales bacterium]
MHPLAAHGEVFGSIAQQEPLLDLRVARTKLVDGHVRTMRAAVRVVGDDGERARRDDSRHFDVADVVRHGLP